MTLPSKVKYQEGGGQLNPDWVEWLMGWPIGWTSIKPLKELIWLSWDIDPADMEDDSFIPRVAMGIKDRVNKLKALGNGQVPLCTATAWEILTSNKEKSHGKSL